LADYRNYGSLAAQRVLITGASRGIGHQVARDFAAAGAAVWLTATTAAVLEVAAQLGGATRACPMNVADAASVEQAFALIRESWGGLDAVIHAAAELGPAGPFWELESAGFESVLRVNTLGAFHVAKAFVRLWTECSSRAGTPSRGKIILFAGGGAGYGYPRFLPYGTSKVAGVRMCETMSMELESAGIPIDINIIAPGANDTDMLKAVRAAGGEVRTVTPFSKPIALCRWLVSPASDGVGGRFLHVNDAFEGISAGALPSAALKLRRIDL
jgi:NAD(P)-dependent dehydrogenase (short-subunit alcohol dehydrogenase family)